MAMDSNDLLALKGLQDHGNMTAYEQFKVGHMQSKRASGVAIAGLCVGVAGVVAAVAGAAWAGSRAKAAKEVAEARAESNQRQLDQLTALFAAERQERIAGDVTLTNTVNDSVSGSQQGTLTAQQAAELAASQATQQIMQQTFADAVTGRSSLNPTPVQIFSAPQPCGCPGGCGRG